MKIAQAQIRDFMIHAEQATPNKPCLPPLAVRAGRLKWLAEELCELANAWGLEIELDNKDLTTDHFTFRVPAKPQFDERDPSQELSAIVDAYDANIDLMVFTVGNCVAGGTELEPGWEEVHTSNMSKFTDGHKRADGKWIKGPSYRKANLRPIIVAQLVQQDTQADLELQDKPAS